MDAIKRIHKPDRNIIFLEYISAAKEKRFKGYKKNNPVVILAKNGKRGRYSVCLFNMLWVSLISLIPLTKSPIFQMIK